MSEDKCIVQGDYSQSHRMFGDSAGNQCTAIVIYAMAYSKLVPCIDWTSNTMNRILNYGNDFYNYCLSRANLKTHHLSCEECLGLVEINRDVFNVQLYPQFQNSESSAAIYDKLNFENLRLQLRIFYNSKCSYVVLTANGYTYGIIKQFDMIYFYDSHAKDLHGNTILDGKASLRLFKDLDSLVNYITFIYNFNENEYFQLTYLNITKLQP